MRKPLVAGNWKMHGSRAENASLVETLLDRLKPEWQADVMVCPPFVYLWETARMLKDSDVTLGAQSICAESIGAFTGEVSGAMLRDVGCRYALVGHSERRQLYGESDALVARKFVAAQAQGLLPVLCVGETLEEREAEVHAMIRAKVAALDATIAVSVRILYGGSVKASNARELFAMADIDGGLVGGASLKAEEFAQICAAAG